LSLPVSGGCSSWRSLVVVAPLPSLPLSSQRLPPCVCVSGSTFPFAYKDARRIGFKIYPKQILITSAKTLSPDRSCPRVSGGHNFLGDTVQAGTDRMQDVNATGGVKCGGDDPVPSLPSQGSSVAQRPSQPTFCFSTHPISARSFLLHQRPPSPNLLY